MKSIFFKKKIEGKEDGVGGGADDRLGFISGTGANNRDGVNGRLGANNRDGVNGRLGANNRNGANERNGVNGKKGVNAGSGVNDRKGVNTGNAGQKEAIGHKDGPMMVLAGPGSGKTFVIVHRLCTMINEYHIPPEEILVITFTKAAALEMQERFLNEMESGGENVTFGTFHAVYFQILKASLGYRQEHILSDTDKERYLKMVLALHPSVTADAGMVEYLLTEFSGIKNQGISPEDYVSEVCLLDKTEFQTIFREYEAALDEEHMLDFDDMVLKCRDLFQREPEILHIWQERYRYILVDEFQDINPMQYEVLRMLAKPQDNLFIVGDDDQSIYGFRGSEPGIMLHFPKDYPGLKKTMLQVNYRSTEEIVDRAMHLIRCNKNRYPKDLSAAKTGTDSVRAMGVENKEAQGEALVRILQQAGEYMDHKDCAVLFRTNSRARFYSRCCSEAGIPFYLKEKVGSVFRTGPGRDILSMLAFAHGDHRRSVFLNFYNRPPRYISRSLLEDGLVDLKQLSFKAADKPFVAAALRRLAYDMEKIRDMHVYAAVNYIRKGMEYENWLLKDTKKKGRDPEEIAEILENISLSAKKAGSYRQWLEAIEDYEAELKNSHVEGKDAVQLVTMHSSKGLEYKLVVIPDCNEGILPPKKIRTMQELEEERRVFYVAVTRAKERLILLHLKKNPRDKILPSRFLRELGLPVG